MPVKWWYRLDFFSPFFFFFFSSLPSLLCTHTHTHTHVLTAQSLARRGLRHSCFWTLAHLSAQDLPSAAAKNFLGLAVNVVDPSGTENPEMPGSILIFCQEQQARRPCQVPIELQPRAAFCGGHTSIEGAGRGCIPKGNLCVAAPQLSWSRAAGALRRVPMMTDGRGGCVFSRYHPVFLSIRLFHFWAITHLFFNLSQSRISTRWTISSVELLQEQSRGLQTGIKTCFTLSWWVLSKPTQSNISWAHPGHLYIQDTTNTSLLLQSC